MLCYMADHLTLYHERLDDVPVIIGLANKLGLAPLLNQHLGTHASQQGLDNGRLTVGWLGYILSQADHRKSVVQEWAQGLTVTLSQLLDQPLRAVDFCDDRLGRLLRRFSDDTAWEGIEESLWRASVTVYALPPLTGVRLDSTSSYGYHQPQPAGWMQYGHSKDHRPDLSQLKLMAAAAEPSGQLLASDVVAGQAADDPLYRPLLARVRQIVGQEGVLYSGDCKMAALDTRADIVSHHDFYLTPLPLTGETARAFATWVDAIVDGTQEATLVWEGAQLLGAGYEFVRPQAATLKDASGVTQEVAWQERVLVMRSRALAQAQQSTLNQHLAAAQAALERLTPPPARGKRQFRDEASLQSAIAAITERLDVVGLVEVTWEREETTVTHYRGRGRGGPQRATATETQVRYVIQGVQVNAAALAARQYRLGWRVQVTNAPVTRLGLAAAVVHYRGGWVLERDFHLVKDLPLGLSPLFVWKDDQIKGLVRLLTLGLRLLTLLENQVREGLAQEAATLRGVYPGHAARETARPTAKRLLELFVRAQLTLTRVAWQDSTQWSLTPLSALHQQILRYLRLPASLYAALIPNSS